MANKTWTGQVSTAYATAGNYAEAAAPADGDTLIFGHKATQGCLSGCDAGSNGHTYPAVIVTEDYKYGLGGVGDPLDPTAITQLYFRSRFQGISYIKGAITNGTVMCAGKGTELQLSGALDHLAIGGGHVHLVTGATLTAGDKRLDIGQTAGHVTLVSIDAGLTLTGSTIAITGGQLMTLTSLLTLIAQGDASIGLQGTAAITTLADAGGSAVLEWNSTGTIAMVHVRDGAKLTTIFAEKKVFAQSQTLTEAHMYDDAVVDFRGGTKLMTLTNGIWVHGNNSPMFAPGSLVTAAA